MVYLTGVISQIAEANFPSVVWRFSASPRNSMHRVRDRSINFILLFFFLGLDEVFFSHLQTTNLKVKLSRPNGIACLQKRKVPRRRACECCNH